jgi:hypothetical protein
MKMIVEYLEHARQFEQLAGETLNPEVKARMFEQAEAYRKLANDRAVRLKITTPFEAESRAHMNAG